VEPAQERRLSRAAQKAAAAREALEAEIVAAFLAGGGIREIARLCGVSHPKVKYILDKHDDMPGVAAEQQRRRGE
jgi:hypothetical protein